MPRKVINVDGTVATELDAIKVIIKKEGIPPSASNAIRFLLNTAFDKSLPYNKVVAFGGVES